jgi:hypothetical protein
MRSIKKAANSLPASELSFFFTARKYAVFKEKIYQKYEIYFWLNNYDKRITTDNDTNVRPVARQPVSMH